MRVELEMDFETLTRFIISEGKALSYKSISNFEELLIVLDKYYDDIKNELVRIGYSFKRN